jgi:lipopolysaccharide transport system permease protein
MKIFTDILGRRELLSTLVVRNLKIRYQSSTLGFFWTLLNPLFMMLIYWIFITFMKFPIDPSSLLTGILVWQFLTMCCSDSVNSVAGHPNLVKKIYFPRIILPVSTVLANLVNYLLSLIILFAFTLALGKLAWGSGLAMLPFLILLQLVFGLGLALIISCSSVYFKDTEHIVSVLLMAWFFMSPIIYTLHDMPGKDRIPVLLLAVYKCNPMVGLITLYRSVIMNGPPPGALATAAAVIVPFVTAGIGLAVFNRSAPDFADEL